MHKPRRTVASVAKVERRFRKPGSVHEDLRKKAQCCRELGSPAACVWDGFEDATCLKTAEGAISSQAMLLSGSRV